MTISFVDKNWFVLFEYLHVHCENVDKITFFFFKLHKSILVHELNCREILVGWALPFFQLQFAIVHYFTKYGSGECYFSREDFESDSDSDLDVNGQRSIAGLNQRAAGLSTGSNTLPRSNVEREIFEVIPLSMGTISMRTMTAPAMTRSHRRSYSTWLGWPCRRQRKVSMHAMPSQTSRDRICSHTYASNIVDDDYSDSEMGRNGVRRESNRGAARINITKHRRSRTRRTPRFNSVSKIDRASRIFFPLVFLLINLFYWLLYTHAYAYLPSTNTSNGIKRGCIHIWIKQSLHSSNMTANEFNSQRMIAWKRKPNDLHWFIDIFIGKCITWSNMQPTLINF